MNKAIWNKHGLPERWEKFLSVMVTDDSSQWSKLKSVDGEEKETDALASIAHLRLEPLSIG